ncbi:MAG: hypothetical protein H6828_01050 [Planctomycetes bacterium]|nr:hypothetical protein [Planctomycetota bacterium]
MKRDTTQPRREVAPQTPSPAKPVSDEPVDPRRSKKPLDFSKLDLRVETVDERISPSETNVFDK